MTVADLSKHDSSSICDVSKPLSDNEKGAFKCNEVYPTSEVNKAQEASRRDFFFQDMIPKFSRKCSENIEVNIDSMRNSVKAYWKFSNSCGLAFSRFPLSANQTYEVIFSGNGHARMGFTQTNPDYLLVIQESVKKSQILFLADIRLRNHQYVLDIVKKVDASGTKIETMYNKDHPKIKDIVPSMDV